MIHFEKTSNGVRYTWSLASSEGASFVFYKDEHSQEEVKKAISEIKNTRDMVYYRIANEQDYVDIYWDEVFHIGEKKHNLTWKNMEYDYKKLRKAYLKKISAEDFVKQNLKEWKSNIKVIR